MDPYIASILPELCRDYSKILLRFIKKKLVRNNFSEDDAEDILQDTWCILLYRGIKPDENIKSVLFWAARDSTNFYCRSSSDRANRGGRRAGIIGSKGQRPITLVFDSSGVNAVGKKRKNSKLTKTFPVQIFGCLISDVDYFG